jgi:hypothetical protein
MVVDANFLPPADPDPEINPGRTAGAGSYPDAPINLQFVFVKNDRQFCIVKYSRTKASSSFSTLII